MFLPGGRRRHVVPDKGGRGCDADGKAEPDRGLGARRRYDPVKHEVRAEIRLDPHQKSKDPREGMLCVRGGT